MIKKRFNFWDRLLKNFSVTYIGYGKFLYYYRDPRTREIIYGKVDMATSQSKLLLSTISVAVLTTVLISYNFYGSPAPATPQQDEKGRPLLQFSFDEQKSPSAASDDQSPSPTSPQTTRGSQDQNQNQDQNQDQDLKRLSHWQNLEQGGDSSQGFWRLLRQETDKVVALAQQKSDDKDGQGVTTKELHKADKARLKEIMKKKDGDVAKTTIDDEATENMKRAFMLSDATSYTPERDSKKVKIYHYTVRPGDSVSELAHKFGVSMHTIGGGSKKITNMDELWPGTKLVIPSKDGILKKMKKGQSLAMIANKYKVPLQRILRLNDFDDPDNIPVGSHIFLPDVKPPNVFFGMMWPIRSRITSGYGWRIHPILRRRLFHDGIDLAVRYSRIRAAKSGKVVFSGRMGGYGKVVILSHPGHFKTLYAHNSRLYVRVGQYVRQGQWLARSGNTGRSTGPHLHFEVWKHGRHVNPLSYLRKR